VEASLLEEFDESRSRALWDGPYHGADFGFAQDPNTLVRCWIAPGTIPKSTGRLMIEYEAYKVGQDTDDIPDAWKRDVPGCEQYVIRADSARPETISYLARHGFPQITGVDKWSRIRRGRHRASPAVREDRDPPALHARGRRGAALQLQARPRTGDVLPDIVDAHNHIWDAVRYALAPLIKADTGLIDYYAQQVAEMQRVRSRAHGGQANGTPNGGQPRSKASSVASPRAFASR
jgi:phage terminase large subunit